MKSSPLSRSSPSRRITALVIRRVLLPGLVALVTAACARQPAVLLDGVTATVVQRAGLASPPPSPTPSFTPMPTPTPSMTPTATSTPTATPTPTQTPTPTALPLLVRGALPQAPPVAPTPQSGAPCGLVDTLDFPLDPPDGDDVSGGGDFATFRSRYDGHHTGEDWWGQRGRSSFGMPVYSIGHGRVTYAAPLGWGRDKGVLIIRHTLATGATFLSFYGHLDPPSVTLVSGDCVTRGQQIGQIGRPRTSPHLHFEIRTHLPFAPGPGYWAEDPRTAGWLSPSRTIWGQRIAAAPGVLWVEPDPAAGIQPVGPAGGDLFLLKDDEALRAVGQADGQTRWQWPLANRRDQAMVEPGRDLVYLVARTGLVQALLPAAGQPARQMAVAWELDLEVIGTPALAPLPGGGVLISQGQQIFAVSPDGAVRWQREGIGGLEDWVISGDQLIVSTPGRPGSVWRIPPSGQPVQLAAFGGRLAVAGDQLYLCATDGLYRWAPDSEEFLLLYELPSPASRGGSLTPLPGGGLLLVHADFRDRRLFAFGPAGDLRWQRSYARIGSGPFQPFLLGDQVYLLAQDNRTPSNEISLYALDATTPGLTPLFSGGTRSASPGANWFAPVAEQGLLVQIGGGALFYLDVQSALEAAAGN